MSHHPLITPHPLTTLTSRSTEIPPISTVTTPPSIPRLQNLSQHSQQHPPQRTSPNHSSSSLFTHHPHHNPPQHDQPQYHHPSHEQAVTITFSSLGQFLDRSDTPSRYTSPIPPLTTRTYPFNTPSQHTPSHLSPCTCDTAAICSVTTCPTCRGHPRRRRHPIHRRYHHQPPHHHCHHPHHRRLHRDHK